MSDGHYTPAPPLQVAQWFNTEQPLTLQRLRGRVVLLHAFQMLCPGCVAQALPQAQRVHQAFTHQPLAVVGLHTVFEHHAAQGSAAALTAFIHEYRLGFPIGLDQPDPHGGAIPLTMQALNLRGTPSLVLLDGHGRIRAHHFGQIDDLLLGTMLGQLLTEAERQAGDSPSANTDNDPSCADGACPRTDTA